MKVYLLVGLFATLGLSAASAYNRTGTVQAASIVSPVQALQRLATSTTLQPFWFTAEFTNLLPQIQTNVRKFTQDLGVFQKVEAGGQDTYWLRYARGSVQMAASLNAQGQFKGLRLLGIQPQAGQTASTAPGTTGTENARTTPNVSPTRALQRLATSTTLQPSWFTAEFTNLLPQIQASFRKFTQDLGAFQKVEAGGQNTYWLRYARGSVQMAASLNAQGQFKGLRLLQVQP